MTPRSTSSSGSSSGAGIDLLTLVITAIASAAAAYACSKVWAPGSLPAAAMTPVLVALIKEALARPAKVVTQAVPVRGVVRSAPGPAGTEVHDAVAEPHQPDLERVAQQGEITYHSSGPDWSDRRWRLAVITGLLGFVIAVLVFTVPELVSGKSLFGGGGQTTLFGGQSHHVTRTTTAPARTVTVPPTQTLTAPPVVTVTAPPVATTPAPAPAGTQPPAETTPAPAPSGPGSTGPTGTVPAPIAP